MMTVETIGRVRHAFLVKGKAIKQIARELRLTRNTFRAMVRGTETEHRYRRRDQRFRSSAPCTHTRQVPPRMMRVPALHGCKGLKFF